MTKLPIFIRCLAALVLALGSFSAWAASLAAQAVAQATLVIGSVQVDRGGQLLTLQTKQDLMAGDILRTTESGHVHVRFVDGGLVSVRPNSVFELKEYRYDPKSPESSVVRFELHAGEVRAISGKAAKAARDRFRLNTPLIAIGVRGTDFVARSVGQDNEVRVNEGAVVVAPIGGNCLADGLGACSGGRAKELSADMGHVALVYRAGALDLGLRVVQPGEEDSQVQQLEQKMREGRRDTSSSISDPLDPAALVASPLEWARWPSGARAGDTLSVSFFDAMERGDAVVGDGYFFLFRGRNGIDLISSMDRPVRFDLGASSATYFDGVSGAASAAAVDSGNLTIDFGQGTWDSKITGRTPAETAWSAAFSGAVDVRRGTFSGASAEGGYASGASNLEGTAAGYYFRQPLANGDLVRGATSWGK